MNRLAALVAAFALLVSNAASLENKPDKSDIASLVKKRDQVALIEMLSALKLSDAKKFASQDYDYLLARAAESEGRLALAMSNYRTVADRNSPLRAYALARLTRIARSTGNLMLERFYLAELLISTDDEVLRAGAQHRLARNAFETENYKEAIRQIKSDLASAGKTSVANTRETKAFLGEAYRLSGDVENAKKIFNNVLSNTPKPDQPDDAALAAVKGLDAIDGNDPLLEEAEHWRRANVYQFNRYFDEARMHFTAVLAANRTGEHAAEAMFQIGRGFAQKENFVEAIEWYQRVIEQFPESSVTKDALLQLAAAYSRVGKPKEAITRYQSFIEKYPNDEKLDRAYLNIVDVLRDKGSDTEALKWCAKAEEAFRGKVPEALAVFAKVRIYMSKEDWQNALIGLDQLGNIKDLGGANHPGGTTKAEVTFLKAYVLEQQKNYSDAVDVYLSIPDGRNEYYGWRASQRLKLLANSDAAKPHTENKLAELFNNLKSRDAKARRIGALGILRLTDDEKARERALSALKSNSVHLPNYKVGSTAPEQQGVKSDAVNRLLALGLRDEAFPDKAANDLASIESEWKKLPADFPIELIPKPQLAMLYPVPFASELLSNSVHSGVDPRFLLAIQRQESRFLHDARSPAAARGLMQFIHPTARRIANELNRDFFSDDEIYDPEVAILFGSHYIANLFKIFPERPEAVAAAYNGGETNVKRWLARVNSSEPERYMPEIIFGQTKDYVAKVMANYRMYQYLYDERLALKPTRRSE